MARTKAQAKALISRDVQALGIIVANIESNPEIATAMAPVGYSPLRLADLRQFYGGVSDTVSRQVSLAGAGLQATEVLRVTKRTAKQTILTLFEACRHEFRDEPALLAKVGADQPLPEVVPQLTTVGLAAFDNAAADATIAARLSAAFGYTPERFAAEREKILALIAARRAREDAKGAAQQATADQNAGMKRLRRELSSIRAMAKQALRDKPQLLEKLGIVARTTRTAAQRNAGKKAAATRKAKKDAGAPAGP